MNSSPKRSFTAAPKGERCQADITLHDGSRAQCMRKAKRDGFCWQHGCDCQCPEPKSGAALISMSCRVHNF